MNKNINLPIIPMEDNRTGLSVETLKRAILDNLFYVQGKFPAIATPQDYYRAVAYTVRDRLLQHWFNTSETYLKENVRIVAYLSSEFLLGPHLSNNLINLGINEAVCQAVTELKSDFPNIPDFAEILEIEEEPGLGNGGLGRLAACYMDSLATLEIPAISYGIRYEFGIFDQEIENGWQKEITDKWLKFGNPWEIVRPEAEVKVKWGGHTEPYFDENGRYQVKWIAHKEVKGIPYDTPILGYKKYTANTLRLWKAEAVECLNFSIFKAGDYFDEVQDKVDSENLTKILYPNDDTCFTPQPLRLEQQYFFVSCSLQDIIRLHLKYKGSLDTLHEKFTLQLNDTHPAIAIAELMHLLVDEHHLEWEQAWDITTKTFAYTNHSLLPEALERWSIRLFQSLLPRHLQIIYEINYRFLQEVALKYPDDRDRLRRMSLIDETGDRYIRMAHLASVGSYAINGVAALHTELLKEEVLQDFAQMYPEKFSNKTNGVTPRRFLLLSNPKLADLISQKIGEDWINNLEELRQLEKFVDRPEFRQKWRNIKLSIKQELAHYIEQEKGIKIDPYSLFDIQAKRIHEYKRPHLNVLHIITLYNQIKANPDIDITPRTFIFGGKATPGYFMAQLIIKLINSVADVVNNDPDVRDRLKVVFLKDYNVKFAQRVYPAADLSEQISLAGREASGTGNMKFAMNGALTIGTFDGANIEIREAVGCDNFFLFGLTEEEVYALKASDYNPWYYYHQNSYLRHAIDQIGYGFFSPQDPELFRPLLDNLMTSDEYLLLVDYGFYIECQERVSQAYRDLENWTKMSILNVARIGKFSSDRAIREYCQEIWHVEPVTVEPKNYL
jgi:glycogen phosphorylase